MVPNDLTGLRFDQALAKMLPEFSRSRLQNWISSGKILLDGKPAAIRQKVWGGEKVEVEPEADPSDNAFQAEDIPLAVLYEDESILVIDKPAGLVVHPGSGNWEGTMLNALLHHCPQLAGIPRAGIVHRLDKETSGLLVVAKTLAAQTSLVRQLQERSVKRIYLALVHGNPPESGTVDEPIGRHPRERTKMAVGRGKEARTHFKVLQRFAGCTLVECSLESGRTHQIRVHMQHLGFPLVGDPVYGKTAKSSANRQSMINFRRQALHAKKLSLIHPQSGESMTFESELAEDFRSLLQELLP